MQSITESSKPPVILWLPLDEDFCRETVSDIVSSLPVPKDERNARIDEIIELLKECKQA